MPTYAPQVMVQLTIAIGGVAENNQATFIVPPLSARWVSNSYRKADTAVVRLPYNLLPLDPRAVDSATMTIYIRDAYHTSTGARDPAPELYPSFVSAASGLPTAGWLEQRHVVFAGPVDTFDTDVGDFNSGVITIEARDNTAIFLDRQIPNFVDAQGNKQVQQYPIDRPLYDVFIQVLEAIGQPCAMLLANFRERYAVRSPTHPLSKVLFNTLGRRPDQTSWEPGTGQSYWEMLSELCEKVAAAPHIAGTELFVESTGTLMTSFPRTVYAFDFGSSGAKTGGMSGLSFSKRLGHAARRPVVVRQYNPNADAITPLLEGRYPPTPVEVNLDSGATTGGKKKPFEGPPGSSPQPKDVKDDAAVYGVEGTRSAQELQQIAATFYRELYEGDVGGSFTTKDMLDAGLTAAQLAAKDTQVVRTSASPQPTWKLRSGDTVYIDMLRSDWRELWGLPEDQGRRLMRQRGMSHDQISQLYKAYRLAESNPQTFKHVRVIKATHTLSQQGHYQLSVEFASALGEVN